MGDDDVVLESTRLRQSTGRLLSSIRALLEARLQEVASGSESTFSLVLASVLQAVSQAVEADWGQIAETASRTNLHEAIGDAPVLSQAESAQQLVAASMFRLKPARRRVRILLQVLASVFSGVGVAAIGVRGSELQLHK